MILTIKEEHKLKITNFDDDLYGHDFLYYLVWKPLRWLIRKIKQWRMNKNET